MAPKHKKRCSILLLREMETFLEVLWLRLSLVIQGMRVRIPGWEARTPHVSWAKNQNIKQKQYCNRFSRDFKNGPHHLMANVMFSYIMRRQSEGREAKFLKVPLWCSSG